MGLGLPFNAGDASNLAMAHRGRPFMNSRQINLVLGAVALGLLGTIFFMMSWAKNRQIPEVVDRTNYVANTVTQITVKKFNATNLLAALTNRTLNWSAIESTNYLFYMLNLRSIGCPEETIRDIIIADVAKLYARKQAELLRDAPPPAYWRTKKSASDPLNPAVHYQLAALENEKRQLVKDLLGVSYRSEIAKFDVSREPLARLQGVFPPETLRQMQDVMEAYERETQELSSRGGGYWLPDEEVELREIEMKREEALSQILTPEQLETYELYMSPLAEEMRLELYGFEPSAEEFVDIFNLRKSFEDVIDSSLNANDALSPRMREQALADAETALASEIKSVLGMDRFSQYERATDPNYQQLLRLNDRLHMPAGVIERVYSAKSSAEQQKNTILSNPNLTMDQRQRAIAAITRETETALSEMMGNTTFAAYKQAGSDWLYERGEVPDENQMLVPPAQPPQPPAVQEPQGPRIGDPVPPNAPFPFYQPPIVFPPPPMPNPVPQ